MEPALIDTPARPVNTELLLATLKNIATSHSPAALASSMQAEDMVLTHAVASAGLPIEIFVLDTGRLHSETLQLIERVRSRYGIGITIYRPEAGAVAEYTRRHGRDGFYSSAELRRRCCEIRKVEPLARALSGKRAWITGQRRGQSTTRVVLPEREFDVQHGMEKFNPLAAWSEAEVWQYLGDRDVPYNGLYDQGYRSIGCAPCTRPTLPAEDVRAGRWWWETAEQRECGLHVNKPKA